MDLHSLLLSIVDKDKQHRTALFYDQRSYTYDDLLGFVERVIAEINRMACDPDILILVQNPLNYIIACLASDIAGVISYKLHHGTNATSLFQLVNDIEPDIMMTDLKHIAEDEQICSRVPNVLLLSQKLLSSPIQNHCLDANLLTKKNNRTSTVLFTSGSTGKAKGVWLPEHNIPRNVEIIRDVLSISEHDVGAIVGPLTMGMNLIYVYAHLSSGAAILIEEGFLSPNDTIEHFISHKVTGFSTIPVAVNIMLTRCDRRKLNALSLRYIRIGAGRFTTENFSILKRQFSNLQVFKTYGLTEIGLVSVLCSDDPITVLDSVGKPVPGVKIDVVSNNGLPLPPFSEGEVVVSGKHQMLAYYQNQQDTAAVIKEGRIYTGDIGYKDHNGFLFITDRRKNMIKIAGESIHPGEIENVICRIRGVSDAAVIAMKDTITGEAAKAFVEMENSTDLTSNDILKHCRLKLPVRIAPRSVKIVEKLPRLASGKIDRHKLKRLADTDAV